MSATPRRIVTGHDKNGKSIVLSDTAPPNVLRLPENGVAFYEIWSTSTSPVPLTPNEPEPTNGPVHIEPKRHGNVIRFVDFQPGFSKKGSVVQTPMHRTETIDYGIVLEGEIYLLLDDSEVLLRPGDVVVQRGTLHAWDNRSDKLVRMAFVLMDGAFSGELKASLPVGALESVFRGPMGPPR